MAINMQSYLSALLLISILLVDKSDPARITQSSILGKLKNIFKQTNQAKKGNAGEKSLSPSPPAYPSLPLPLPPVGEKIQGLSKIKDYLSYFGYLQDSEGTLNNELDQDTITAITDYQRYFNLEVTGDLTDETLQQIFQPRCGIPDKNFEYDLTTSNFSFPKGKPQWFPVGTKNLTYGFHPDSQVPPDMIEVFGDAFTLWSQTTNVLNLTNTTYDDADIKIGFYDLSNILELDVALVGGTIIRLQPDSGVKTAKMLLDSTKYWVLPTDNFKWSFEQDEFDLETVVMHQIGHLLGLDHSSNKESVMYPAILPSRQRKVMITYSDNQTLHQLYTISANSGRFAVPFGTSTSGLLTTFSLGFACMALLY